jgi:hypothetical protein
VINLPCNQNCVNVPVKIPHLKTTADYAVNAIAYNPYPYTTTGSVEDVTLYCDDIFGNTFVLPFNFCFFDSSFNTVVVGSNGLITFDAANALLTNGYLITGPIPGAGTGGIGGSNYFPRAAIMAAYSDLDPTSDVAANQPLCVNPSGTGSAPADRKIEWRVEAFTISVHGQEEAPAITTGIHSRSFFMSLRELLRYSC